MNSVLAENVKTLRRRLGMNQHVFAERIGVHQSYISKWEAGKVEPLGDNLNSLAKLAGCPFEDFKSKPLDEIRETTTSQASVPIKQDAGHGPKVPEQPRVHSADAGEMVGILQLDLSLSMGPGRDIEDFVESEVIGFDLSVLRGITRTPADRLRFVTGVGTSHEPKFQSGDQFLININERAITRIDGYYWITFEGGAHGLKRLRPVSGGRVLIMSDNKEDYPPYEVDAKEIRIEGRAIWFARGL